MSADLGTLGTKARSAKACRECGAEYAFATCRLENCPFRTAGPRRTDDIGTDPRARPHVIVVGNEKGGSGKSTIAMHLIVALMKRGSSVASVDLDASQGTLSRYIENRRAYAERSCLGLDLPEHRRVFSSDEMLRPAAEAEETARLQAAFSDLADRDFIVIDTPGSNSYLSRLGQGQADTLITPLNDSFLDLDLLARIDVEGRNVLEPRRYSEAVSEQRRRQVLAAERPLDWIVVRNRLSHIDSGNKQKVGHLLEQLSQRLQFRVAPGFGERVIFRELYLKGLTLLDLREDAPDIGLNMSHLAARQEVRALLNAIALPSDSQETKPIDSDSASTPEGGNRSWIARALALAQRS
jgi:chromosome partitioning protein